MKVIAVDTQFELHGTKYSLYGLSCECGRIWSQIHTMPRADFTCPACGEKEKAADVATKFRDAQWDKELKGKISNGPEIGAL